jgi:hypothetical protein
MNERNARNAKQFLASLSSRRSKFLSDLIVGPFDFLNVAAKLLVFDLCDHIYNLQECLCVWSHQVEHQWKIFNKNDLKHKVWRLFDSKVQELCTTIANLVAMCNSAISVVAFMIAV